jgi:hypothetical protein
MAKACPSPSGLAWLSKAWTEAWPDEAALPYAYPTPEGGVQFEWSTAEASLTAELDLNTRVAEVLVSRTADGEVVEEASLNLDAADAWAALAGLVQRHTKPKPAQHDGRTTPAAPTSEPVLGARGPGQQPGLARRRRIPACSRCTTAP